MLVCACEEVTSVREPDLAAQLDTNFLELLETTLENIHHTNFVCESDHDMEARGMESKRVCFILEYFTDLKSFSMIVPDAHCLISTTSAHKLLFDADIHTIDATRVEGEDEILKLCIISWAFNVYRNSHQLVVFGGEDKRIF